MPCSPCGTSITTITRGDTTTTVVVHFDGTRLTATTTAAEPEPESQQASSTATAASSSHSSRVLLATHAAFGSPTTSTVTMAGGGAATVTVGGFASLMDEASARATTPSITNWRYGWVDGYCRVFNLVSILNIRRGNATGDHLATCTARPRAGARLRVCLYDVPKAEYPELLARERRLREVVAPYTDDASKTGDCVIFGEYSDAEYRAERATTDELWQQEVGQYYDGGLIYRDDLLPVPSYLQRCLKAFQPLGEESLDNFLDQSFLGDGETTIRAYIARGGAEMPPPPEA